MKSLAVPAILLALAGAAHAAIATSFTVNSGNHYVLNDQGPHEDGKVLTPFGGTLRSDLSPLSNCRSTYTATTHTSSCAFIEIDPLTGEEVGWDSERWDGTVNLAAVPEPDALTLFAIGLAAATVLRRRKQR